MIFQLTHANGQRASLRRLEYILWANRQRSLRRFFRASAPIKISFSEIPSASAIFWPSTRSIRVDNTSRFRFCVWMKDLLKSKPDQHQYKFGISGFLSKINILYNGSQIRPWWVDKLLNSYLDVMSDLISLPRYVASRGHPKHIDITGFCFWPKWWKNDISTFCGGTWMYFGIELTASLPVLINSYNGMGSRRPATPRV
jgi:hypothetical protein